MHVYTLILDHMLKILLPRVLLILKSLGTIPNIPFHRLTLFLLLLNLLSDVSKTLRLLEVWSKLLFTFRTELRTQCQL